MKKKKTPPNKLKFVVTYLDDLMVQFTVWEYLDTGMISRCGGLTLTQPTYEELYQLLKNAGAIHKPELRIKVDEDDTPMEKETNDDITPNTPRD
jgi:hypothetical protein